MCCARDATLVCKQEILAKEDCEPKEDETSRNRTSNPNPNFCPDTKVVQLLSEIL